MIAPQPTHIDCPDFLSCSRVMCNTVLSEVPAPAGATRLRLYQRGWHGNVAAAVRRMLHSMHSQNPLATASAQQCWEIHTPTYYSFGARTHSLQQMRQALLTLILAVWRPTILQDCKRACGVRHWPLPCCCRSFKHMLNTVQPALWEGCPAVPKLNLTSHLHLSCSQI